MTRLWEGDAVVWSIGYDDEQLPQGIILTHCVTGRSRSHLNYGEGFLRNSLFTKLLTSANRLRLP